MFNNVKYNVSNAMYKGSLVMKIIAKIEEVYGMLRCSLIIFIILPNYKDIARKT